MQDIIAAAAALLGSPAEDDEIHPEYRRAIIELTRDAAEIGIAHNAEVHIEESRRRLFPAAAPEPHPKACEVETRFGTDHRDVAADVEADAFAGWLIWLDRTDTAADDLPKLACRFRAQFKGYGPTVEDAMAAHWHREFAIERGNSRTMLDYTSDALAHIDWPALTRAALADNWTSYETQRGAHVVLCNY